MKFTCLVTLGFFVAVQSASLFLKPEGIPVKVLYDENHYNTPDAIVIKNIAGSRNLNEKLQVSPNELSQFNKQEEIQYSGNPNSVKNLDAKVQLSPDELRVADKHLPILNVKEDLLNSDLNALKSENAGDESVKPELNENPEQNVNPAEPAKPNEIATGISEEAPSAEVSTAAPTSSPVTTEENLPDPNVVLLIQIAQNIVNSGLESIKENIDNLATGEDGNKNPPITDAQWNRFNQTIQNLFSTLLDRGTRKTSNENLLHNIINGVRSVTNNFLESIQLPVSESFKTASPQAPTPGQNIIHLVNSGFQQITDSIGNIPLHATTKSSVPVEAPASTNAPQGIVNQVQPVLGQSASNSTVLSDTPAPTGPFQAFQNVANQVGQAINNLNPFASTAAPGSQAEEGSAPGNPLQSIQNAANQVGQAINNLNPFNRPPTAAPGSQADSTTPFAPLQSFQNVANQVGEAINNLNPFRPTAAPGSQSEETTNANRPFQAVQNVVNQVGQAVNNFINPAATPAGGAQNEGGSTPLPIQQAFQNVASQIGSAINNLNPFNSLSTPATNLQSDATTTANQPLQGVQNIVGQAGQAISTVAPGNNPVEGVQNIINQIGQVASSLNPLAQSSSTPSSPLSGSLQTIPAIGNQGQQPLGQSSVNPVQSVNKPSEHVSGPVEIIQSIGTEIQNAAKGKPGKVLSEQEIMVAVD